MIRLIAFRELRGICAAPVLWWVLGLLQFVIAWYFLQHLDAFLRIQDQLAQTPGAAGATQAVAVPAFEATAFVLMFLVPLLTMRMFAEERRSQTLVLLMAAPVSDWQIVLGKYAGLMLFLVGIVAASGLTTLSLWLGTTLDIGLFAGCLLGLLLLASSYACIGLYLSTLSAQPMLAAIATVSVLFGSWLAETGSSGENQAVFVFAPTSHFRNLTHGLLASPDLVYFLLFDALFLWLTIRRMQALRSGG